MSNLSEFESPIPIDTEMYFVYIAGYIARKYPGLTENQLLK